MNRSTDFDFGANIGWQDADNLAPWGSDTEAGGDRKQELDKADPASVSGFSEQVGYSGFGALIIDDFQVDAFIKCVSMQLNIFREEIRKMAQAPVPNQNSYSGNRGTAKTNNSNSNKGGFPFLKVDMMSREPRPAKIMDYQIPPDRQDGQRKFNDVVLKLYYQGQIYRWGLKLSSPHYGNLYSWFGGEMEDWKEKSFLLGQEVQEFGGEVYAHTEPMPKEAIKKK